MPAARDTPAFSSASGSAVSAVRVIPRLLALLRARQYPLSKSDCDSYLHEYERYCEGREEAIIAPYPITAAKAALFINYSMKREHYVSGRREAGGETRKTIPRTQLGVSAIEQRVNALERFQNANEDDWSQHLEYKAPRPATMLQFPGLSQTKSATSATERAQDKSQEQKALGSSSAHDGAVRKMFPANKVAVGKTTHAGRAAGAMHARENGASVDGAKALGGWSDSGSFRSCYDRSFLSTRSGRWLASTAKILTLTMFPELRPFVDVLSLYTSLSDPPSALMEQLFPGLEDERARLKERRASTGNAKDYALSAFLNCLEWFREVLLQDAAVLRQHPHWSDFHIFSACPVFSSPAIHTFAMALNTAVRSIDSESERQLAQLPQHLGAGVKLALIDIKTDPERRDDEMNKKLDACLHRLDLILSAGVPIGDESIDPVLLEHDARKRLTIGGSTATTTLTQTTLKSSSTTITAFDSSHAIALVPPPPPTPPSHLHAPQRSSSSPRHYARFAAWAFHSTFSANTASILCYCAIARHPCAIPGAAAEYGCAEGKGGRVEGRRGRAMGKEASRSERAVEMRPHVGEACPILPIQTESLSTRSVDGVQYGRQWTLWNAAYGAGVGHIMEIGIRDEAGVESAEEGHRRS
ncbi:hypothetical protein A4X13_0g4936 [Tilletia indica]|uniref:Ndc10 domain-containing protein n=1 Tax=Tilletia indica TaxID=43049 RepID=A0A177TS87_9BASI|nr:hypothetical protein A4X13_0g4936 [Tilletia indica]